MRGTGDGRVGSRLWGRTIAAAVTAALGLGAVAACEPPPPLPPPGDGSVLVGCDRADERVEITVSSHLDPACTYTLGFDITASGVTLDCQGRRSRARPAPAATASSSSRPSTRR